MRTRAETPSTSAPVPIFERLENLIARLAPGWAATRELDRYRLGVLTQARQYEAAKTSRLYKRRPDSGSPDMTVGPAAYNVRIQARHADENSDVAIGVLNVLVDKIVGKEIRSIPMVRGLDGKRLDRVNTQLAKLWDEFKDRPEVTGEFTLADDDRLLCRTWLRDGEGFRRRLLGNVPGLEHGSRVKLSLDTLEAEFCPIDYNDPAKGIRQGVKKNDWKRPTAYFFAKDHPAEFGFMGMLGSGSPLAMGTIYRPEDLVEVLAAEVCHLKLTTRVKQTRGISIFASILRRLDDLKDYEDSERIAARIGAAFALAITKSGDYPNTGSANSSRFRELGVVPGMVVDNLNPGESVESIKNERPSNQLAEFRAVNLKSISAATRAGYSTNSKNYDGNYSAQRQELLENEAGYDVLRGYFIGCARAPVWYDFVDMVRLQGLVDFTGADLATIYNAEHRGGWTPYIDPQREVSAEIAAVQGGLASRASVALRHGEDPDEIYRQRADEIARETADGLVFSTNAANKAAPAAPVQTTGGGESGGGSSPNDPTQDPKPGAGAGADA